MTTNTTLVNEKLDQAVAILKELDIDAWMVFVRETSLTPDSSLDLILGIDMVWQSAFIITSDNQRIAIVGEHDRADVEGLGGYTQIIPYLEGIRLPLVRTLLELNPRQLALNYSMNDVASDGLGHGLMLLLQRYLTDTDLTDRFISAEPVISALRGRKSRAEQARIEAAVKTTLRMFVELGEHIEPGVSELELARTVLTNLRSTQLSTAWDEAHCPAVSCGPDSPVGHAGPSADYSVQPGNIVHMDFGVKQDDYCADIQRVWYVRREGETSAPAEVTDAFNAARKALLAGFDALKPGAKGWEVDKAARDTLVAEGYPAYQHAFGHHLGRMAHDGATVLGPLWERYGETPNGIIEKDNIFAIELGVAVPGYGYIGLEENVVVTEDGAQWLSTPQTEIWLV